MLQTAAGYRALLARRDKGQYKVSIGMHEPPGCSSWMPSLSFIHSVIRPTWLLSKSHILGKWLSFLFGDLVLSLKAEDNKAVVCLPAPPACLHSFSMCWPTSTTFIRRLKVFKLWNSCKFCKNRRLLEGWIHAQTAPPQSSWLLPVLCLVAKVEIENMAQAGSTTMVCPRWKCMEEMEVVRRYPGEGVGSTLKFAVEGDLLALWRRLAQNFRGKPVGISF